jgi:hypothetical protein
MNKRIKELLEQAGGIEHDDDGDELTPILVGKDLAKFANLIINQCADIAQQHNKSPVAAPLAIGYVIREHFGVEL